VGILDAFCSLGRVAPVEERKDGSTGDPREKIKRWESGILGRTTMMDWIDRLERWVLIDGSVFPEVMTFDAREFGGTEKGVSCLAVDEYE